MTLRRRNEVALPFVFIDILSTTVYVGTYIECLLRVLSDEQRGIWVKLTGTNLSSLYHIICLILIKILSLSIKGR